MINGNTFSNGECAIFSTQFAQYAHRNGHRCEVLRALASETGPMYRIRFDDGYEIAAF
jgi:hypothetical protein